ncbi:(R)-specific enoyl-CoA hydratase [Azospirillaceae bacterium]
MSNLAESLKELNGYFIEDLKVGMSAVFGKTITEGDILLYAGVSGDTNPVHINHEYAANTMFKGRIAHGMLTAGLISALLGTKLPGPGCIYMSQNLKFKAPVKIGDTVMARATITDIVVEKKRVTLKTVCTVGETVVLDGEAVLMVPARG